MYRKSFRVLKITKIMRQLDNIALIVKGLVKLHLIEESEMEPLEYSFKMNTLVFFLKPADVASKQSN